MRLVFCTLFSLFFGCVSAKEAARRERRAYEMGRSVGQIEIFVKYLSGEPPVPEQYLDFNKLNKGAVHEHK